MTGESGVSRERVAIGNPGKAPRLREGVQVSRVIGRRAVILVSSPFSALVSRQRVCCNCGRVCLTSLLTFSLPTRHPRGHDDWNQTAGACDLGSSYRYELLGAGALLAHSRYWIYMAKESVHPGGVAGCQAGRYEVLQVYWVRLYGVIAKLVGSDQTASLTVAKKSRPWCPDGLLEIYGRGDDDDAVVVIGLTGTGVLNFLPLFFVQTTECLGRAKPPLPLVDAKRRSHRLVPEPANSEGAEG